LQNGEDDVNRKLEKDMSKPPVFGEIFLGVEEGEEAHSSEANHLDHQVVCGHSD
jgi:hypothetical protein